MKTKFWPARLHLTAIIILAEIINLSAQTGPAKQEKNVHSLGQGANRFLGYWEMEALTGYVMLRDYSDQTIFSVSICAPSRTNFSEVPLQVWLLVTNGSSLPPLEGGVYDPEGKKACFTFKKSHDIESLQGVAVQSGAIIKFFAIPPSVPRLSGRSQFLFDNLISIPAETLEKFEAGRLRWKRDGVSVIGIKNLKEQLRDDGVNLTWDKDKRVYRIQ